MPRIMHSKTRQARRNAVISKIQNLLEKREVGLRELVIVDWTKRRGKIYKAKKGVTTKHFRAAVGVIDNQIRTYLQLYDQLNKAELLIAQMDLEKSMGEEMVKKYNMCAGVGSYPWPDIVGKIRKNKFI